MIKYILFFFILITYTQAFSAIYGKDNRQEVSLLPPLWQKTADSIALALPEFYLADLDEDHFYHDEFDIRTYHESVGVCPDERFSEQKSFGHCTAFLVHPQVLVTAGHCLIPAGKLENETHSYCDSFAFWLGYNSSRQPLSALGSLIPKQDVLRCKKVIYAENNGRTEPEDNPRDFAILELQEPVYHVEPLPLSDRQVRKGQRVATIGHPHGLPAKFSGYSPLMHNYETTLSAYLDTLGGNSGGPSFNDQAEVVGILISGHQSDTYKDKSLGCNRINRCNNRGMKCNKGSGLENSNLLLKNQIWLPYVEQYLSSKKKSLL